MPGTQQLKYSTNERVLFETIIQFKPTEEDCFSGHCGDLSTGGIYLKTDYPFAAGDTINLSFSLPDQGDHQQISCNAKVAWTNYKSNRRKPTYPAGVGLQFLNLSRTEIASLSTFVDEYDHNKKMNVLCAWCGRSLGLRKGPVGATSHGLCSTCRETMEL